MRDETTAAQLTNNGFVWHDLMSTDPDASKAFYAALFDWDIQDIAMPHGTYRMIHDRPAGEGGEGQGGIEAVPQEGVPSHWIGYVAVPDVDAAVKTAVELGGKVHLEPTDIPDVGRFAIVADPAGAVVAPFRSVHGDLPELARPRRAGQFCFDELLSTDTEACSRFYPRVFGWRHESMAMPDMTYHLFRHGQGAAVKDRAGMLAMPPEAGAPPHWLPYIAVDDVDACCAKAEGLGAAIHKPPADIPELGRFAVLGDPQGASFAVWKQNEGANG